MANDPTPERVRVSDERAREILERVESALDGWGEFRHMPTALCEWEHLPAVTIEDIAAVARQVIALREENATLREIAGQAINIARLPDAEFERLDCGKAVEALSARLDALGGG